MNIWIVAWLPFMASPFDTPEGVYAPGVDAEQAIDNVKRLVRIDRTAMVKAINLNSHLRDAVAAFQEAADG